MKFAKIYDNKRYGQIVIMMKQNDGGAPEIRFFFQPEGYGVCDFSIGFNDESADEHKFAKAFAEMNPKIAVEIIDGYLSYMKNETGKMN